jgi:hypothetical protein
MSLKIMMTLNEMEQWKTPQLHRNGNRGDADEREVLSISRIL